MSTWDHHRTGDTPTGYLSLREAATWASVSQRTLRRWIGQGLPKYQAGRRAKVLVRPEDIAQFLTKSRVPVVDLNRLVDEVLQTLA
jgi:predicted site-specific integrase-resolvase